MFFSEKGQRLPVRLLVASPVPKTTAVGGGEGSLASRHVFLWPVISSTQFNGPFSAE